MHIRVSIGQFIYGYIHMDMFDVVTYHSHLDQ